MIFFTRRLYQGGQPNSGWERRAEREWERLVDIYAAYAAIVRPLLPASIARVARGGPHDAKIMSIEQKDGTLSFVLDCRHALGRFRGGYWNFTFTDVKNRIKTRGLVGDDWLYQEVHLSSRARFALHVLFEKNEIEIEADELLIKKTKGEKQPRNRSK
jgi:hypothetical protein